MTENILKRLFITSACLLLAIIAIAYTSLPHLLKEPLVELNRRLSSLTENTVTVGTHRVHYLEGGSGEPVLLLHGIFSEKDHWVDFARLLTPHYRVIVPDLPGYGESSRLDSESYDYDAQTERLKNLLDTLGIRRAHLAGNSMGGTIAALFAMRYPERVATVSFIGAPHGIRTAEPSEMDKQIALGKAPLIAHDEAEFEQMLSLLFVNRPFIPHPILHAAQEEAISNARSNARLWQEQLKDRFLLHQRIAELRSPTFAVWGSGDLIFHVSGAEVLRSQLKAAEVRVLPGAGHLPMMEAPRETASMYANFLKAAQH